MHELSLCEAIAHKVRERADGRPVQAVMVQIGYFRQVVPDAMLFSWEVLTSATELESTRLEIEHVPAVVICRDCDAQTRLTSPAPVCGTCEGHNVELLTGDEFLVVALEIAEA